MFALRQEFARFLEGKKQHHHYVIHLSEAIMKKKSTLYRLNMKVLS